MVLQIIMVRLQRVTFLALHNYLGLTTELFNPVGGKLISAHSHTHTQTGIHSHTEAPIEKLGIAACVSVHKQAQKRHVHTPCLTHAA